MLQSFRIILMVVFTSSQSFAMLPHESSSWQREVKMAAERDADHDINHFLWITAGLGTTAVCCLGAYIGYIITDSVTYSPYDYNYEGGMTPQTSDRCLGVPVANVTPIRFIGYFGGGSACVGLSFLGIYVKPSSPPPERFIGKSPEYIEYYTAVYTSKARSNRIKAAAAGTVAGFGVLWLLYQIQATQ